MRITFYFRAFFLSYILLLVNLCSDAQKVNVVISDLVEFTPKSKVFKYGGNFISFEQSGVKNQMGRFRLYKEKFHIKLFKQDRFMKLVKEVALSNGERVYGPFTPSLRKMNNKLYLVYFQMPGNSDDVPIRVMAGEIDTLSLTLLAPKEILTIDYKPTSGPFIVANTLTTDKLEIKQSPNNSTTLVTWSSGDNNQYFYSVLDSNLTTIWFKKGMIETSKKIQLTGSCIDNNENIYLGFRSVQKKGLEGGHLIIGQKKTNDKDVPLTINEGKANEVNLVISSKEGNVKVIGTYKIDSDNLYGVYATSVNASNSGLNNVRLTPFPIDLLEQLKKEEWEWASTKGKSQGIWDYLDMEAYEHGNGTIDMVGMFERIHYPSHLTIFGSVFLAHFNNGEATFCRVPKYEANTLPYLSSRYSVIVNNNTTIILYNDLITNLNNDINKHIYSGLSSNNIVLSAATISDGRVIKRDKVFDIQNENLLAITDWIVEIEPKFFLVPIQKVKTFGKYENLSRFATITID